MERVYVKRGAPLIGLVVLLLSGAALAQSDDEVARDRARFAEAVALADGERYDEALEIFEELQRARPHPVILNNVAWCLSRLGRQREALERFEEYLGSGDASEERREAALAERDRLAEALRPPPPPPPAQELTPDPSPEAPSPPPEPVRSRRRLRSGWFWATLGLSLATGAAMTATGAVTLSLSDRWLNEGDVNDRDTGRTLRTVTDGLLIATVVEAVAALVLGLFTDFGGHRDGEAAASP